MPGKPTSGNRSAKRGKPTRIRRTITKDAALALRLLAWHRYGRPATDDEEDAMISALIEEERQHVAPPLTDEQRAETERILKAIEAEDD